MIAIRYGNDVHVWCGPDEEAYAAWERDCGRPRCRPEPTERIPPKQQVGLAFVVLRGPARLRGEVVDAMTGPLRAFRPATEEQVALAQEALRGVFKNPPFVVRGEAEQSGWWPRVG